MVETARTRTFPFDFYTTWLGTCEAAGNAEGIDGGLKTHACVFSPPGYTGLSVPVVLVLVTLVRVVVVARLAVVLVLVAFVLIVRHRRPPS